MNRQHRVEGLRRRHLERTEKFATALYRQLERNHWRDVHGKIDFATVGAWRRVTAILTKELLRETKELLRQMGPPERVPVFRSLLDGGSLDRFSDAEFEQLCEIDMREARRLLDIVARRQLRGRWNAERRRRAAAVPATDPTLPQTSSREGAPS
jgi:hypothetical protein